MKAKALMLLPDELVEAVAERVLERLPVESAAWMGVDEAASYLACSRHRLYRLVSMGKVPHEHEGRRLLFSKQALDQWVRAGGAR